MASGKLIASFAHHDTVRWAAFSPDGARILTASWDKTAKLWDAATPRDMARQVKESGSNTARTGSSVSKAGSPRCKVELLSGVAGGLQFSEDGSLVAADEKRRSRLTTELKELAQELRPNGRFIRWFFSTAVSNDISGERGQIAEWVDNAF